MLIVRLLIFVLCLRGAPCLESPFSPPRPLDNGNNPRSIRVASLNKNGGNVKYFDLVTPENTSSENDTMVRFKAWKDPRLVVGALGRQLMPALRTTFLPTGFPNKTPPGYLQFSIWSWIQDISTQLRSVLATQKILEGVGVGKEGATALSALFNFLVRDGCGMAANLLFTYSASSRFRTDVKRWRLFADLSVDIGITLETAATLFPRPFFLPCICLGNMFKAICGVAAGACGGSINLHWAKGSDISDINAKSGAQHTVTGAIGLVFAGFFARSVSKVPPQTLWLMYFVLTFLHLFANVRCMRLIAFDYFNTIRFDMLLKSCEDWKEKDAKALSPEEIASEEPLWFQFPIVGRIVPTLRKKMPPVYFGVSFDEFCQRSGKPIESLKSKMEIYLPDKRKTTTLQLDNYIISTGCQNLSSPSDPTGISKPCVVVSFLADVSREEQAKAYFHAWLLARQLQAWLETKMENSQQSPRLHLVDQLDVEADVEKLLESMWTNFQQRCTHAGWDFSQTELRTLGYEVKVV